jgi:hypothetical protein
MRKTVLLIAVIPLCMPGIAVPEKRELGVTLDLTYMSKYLSKGSESYGQQGALFKTIDVDLYGTGFGLRVKHRNHFGFLQSLPIQMASAVLPMTGPMPPSASLRHLEFPTIFLFIPESASRYQWTIQLPAART